MFDKRFCLLTSAMGALVVLLAATRQPVLAQPPEPEPRYFAEYTGSTCVDWEADSSRRIVAHSDGQNSVVIEFATVGGGIYPGNVTVEYLDDEGNTQTFDLEGSTWIRMPVVHVTGSGVEQVSQVFWLQESSDSDAHQGPVTGLTARTGPGGDVYHVVAFGIEQLDGSWGPNNSFKYIVSDSGAATFCVSVGLFNK
jgi:hypothetical protein